MSGVYWDPREGYGRQRAYFDLLRVHGHNDSADNVVEDIWEDGGLYPWPSTASAVEVISTSADDNSAGTGAREVTVVGLLEDTWLEDSETVATNGLSASIQTTKKFIRINKAYVSKAGSGGHNAGTISVRVAGAGDVLAKIEFHNSVFGTGRSQATIYTVPADRKAFVLDGEFAMESNKSVDFYLMERVNQNNPNPAWNLIHSAIGVIAPIPFDLHGANFLPGKTDLRVVSYAAAINTRVQSSFNLLLWEDADQ